RTEPGGQSGRYRGRVDRRRGRYVEALLSGGSGKNPLAARQLANGADRGSRQHYQDSRARHRRAEKILSAKFTAEDTERPEKRSSERLGPRPCDSRHGKRKAGPRS